MKRLVVSPFLCIFADMKAINCQKHQRSFAGRLTWRIVLGMLVTMGVTAWFICVTVMAILERDALKLHHSNLDVSKESVRRVLSDIYVATENSAFAIEANLQDPDKVQKTVARIICQNPYIRSCTITFVDENYPQMEPRFQEALQTKDGYWSKPFFENGDPTQPLVSYMRPIHDKQGRTIAVMSTDLSLTWLRSWLAEQDRHNFMRNRGFDSTETRHEEQLARRHQSHRMSFTFLVDKDGTILTNPEPQRIIRDNVKEYARQSADTIDDHLVRKMLAGKSTNIKDHEDLQKVEIDGNSFYILYTHIKHANWSIGLVIPHRVVNLEGYALVLILTFLIGLGLFVLFFISRTTIRRTAKPLTQLAESAGEVAKGNFDTTLPALKHEDEISLLRDSFEEMQRSLSCYVEELKETTAAKASIESELKIAHDIQMSMLPKTFPPYPERDDIDIYGSLTPAKGIGGDLFDFYIRDEHLFFCIGDVSGKGVPAALVMATTRSLFRNISNHESAPEKIAESLNRALSENNDTNMFVTLFVGVLKLSTGLLCYCNAGHDSPLLIGRKVGTLPCDSNLPLGIEPDWTYTLQKAAIDSETTIFLFTDGLNEAENINHEQFGDDRIRQVAQAALTIRQHQSKRIIEQMTDAVHQFVGEAEQSDDLTMLAIQYIETTKTT